MLSRSEIKYIQSLQQKKFRDEHHVFVAEGPKLVMELLAAGSFRCLQVFSIADRMDALSSTGAVCKEISEIELGRISGLQTPHQVLAIFEKAIPRDFSSKGKISLLLEDIQDPGNLGTLIRICDWFGIPNIVCSHGTVDQYNPKVVQSTMASLGRVNVFYDDTLNWLNRQPGVKKLAAVMEGESLRTIPAQQECIVMIGNESKGLSKSLISAADQAITIPGSGSAESLNAAVAAGIIMYQITGAVI